MNPRRHLGMSAIQRSEVWPGTATRKAGGVMKRNKYDKAIASHFRESWGNEIEKAHTFALHDLLYGPLDADTKESEGYPEDWNFSVCVDILREWANAYVHEAWLDVHCDCVLYSEPEGFIDEDGTPHEPFWEDFVYYDIRAVKRAVFGEVAEYV